MATNSTPVALDHLPVVSQTYPKRYYVLTADDIAKKGGAYTQVDFILETFPAGSVIYSDRIKHSAAVAGGSISASTARLYWGTQALGSGALDVFAAPGTTDGTHSISGVTPYAGDMEASTVLLLRLTTTSDDMDATTAGEIHAWVDVSRPMTV